MSRGHTGRRTISVLLAVALILSVGVGLAAPHVAIARPVLVNTSASLAESAVANFHFAQPEYAQVPVNTSINVTFSNDDTTGNDHTFTILDRANWVIPNSWTNITQLVNQHGFLVNLTASANHVVSGAFVAPGPGWYEFVCEIGGHFEAGMYGFIAFGMDLPSNLTLGGGAQGPGLAVFIIVGTIVGLTVLSLVLGFVVGRRHGGVHEMPPERLGYPEPTHGTSGPAEPPRAGP